MSSESLPGRSQSAHVPRPRGVFGGGAWGLGRISGIQIAVDHSWILIFALITFSLAGHFTRTYEGWSQAHAWSAAIVTSLLFFTSIVLHELGHSLTAQRLGLRVRSITLFVFGGVAQLESDPKRPRDEVVIAIAGPLVSLALAGLFHAAAIWLAGETLHAMATWLARINWILAVFNCVPGFPLDGGRVLRGIVWAITGSFTRATSVAAASGTLIAYTLIVLGIVAALGAGQIIGGLWLAFIGWFLLSAARSSVGQLVVERILSRVRGDEVTESIAEACVSGSETVADLASEAVLRHGLRTFYVVDRAAQLRGLVTLRELAAVPAAERARVRVEEVMVPVGRLSVLHPSETAWAAMRRMAERGVNQLPVVADGRLLGAVTRERLLRLVQGGLALESGSEL
jgi:Zn-dependent protease